MTGKLLQITASFLANAISEMPDDIDDIGDLWNIQFQRLLLHKFTMFLIESDYQIVTPLRGGHEDLNDFHQMPVCNVSGA